MIFSAQLRSKLLSMRSLCTVMQCMGAGMSRRSACAQVAVFDQKWYVQFTAILNILRMVFICLVLALGVYMINQDAVRLVLRPIERMLRKVCQDTDSTCTHVLCAT